MTWVSAAVAVGTAVYGASQSKKAAKAANQGEQAAIDEQRRQFDLTRSDNQPWLQGGGWAMGQLQNVNSGDYSGFQNSPDYLWARDQGLQGVDRSAAARGGMYSGGADADRMKFASGLASQNLGNYRGSLQSMAGLGQNTASSLGQMGMQMGQNIGQNYSQMGANRATSYGNNYALAGGALNQAGGALSQWYGNQSARNGGGTGWYLGNRPGQG
jgi:hypothetical protein